ncbi:DUF4212 domain-containing protein [Pelagicoccus sp. NFK12]|uniref:DUF4212 domain-containing protein n=1 Tax=Pelagicoccus enzymogenes TaxID=2773457 RepID=A0A927F7E0_9BACT|nr:DUF4212 domain-containing protein [Pelagicoccus enzymogenes]MBD5779724.1 DUF4212 domain-containing protein [Pelagicoccus enzymogenes]MDQ8201230.1 DUF4212 domain-containing protein [Pelagicoccus enzymogenes]
MSDSSHATPGTGDTASGDARTLARQRAHRRSSLKVILCLLPIWFVVSYGCGILFRDWLDANAPKVGNAPFGFWMAQQGSIICFVLLLVVYAVWMGKLDDRFNLEDGQE